LCSSLPFVQAAATERRRLAAKRIRRRLDEIPNGEVSDAAMHARHAAQIDHCLNTAHATIGQRRLPKSPFQQPALEIL
jgi:hypothetical protein